MNWSSGIRPDAHPTQTKTCFNRYPRHACISFCHSAMAVPASAEVPGLKRRTSILGKFLAAFDDSNVNADADAAGDARHSGKIQIKKQLSISQRIQRAFGFGAGASSAAGGGDRDPVQPSLPAESAAVAPLPLPACHRIESMAGTMCF